MSTAVPCRIGADVGGTFTDVILQDGDGRAFITKRLSTPPSYDEAVVEAIGTLAGRAGADARVDEVVHGTTVATNAVIERRGSRTALVTTAGFPDVLELRRLQMPQMYDPSVGSLHPSSRGTWSSKSASGSMRTGRSAERPLRTRFERSPGSFPRLGRRRWRSASCSRTFPDHEREIGAVMRDEGTGRRRDALERHPARAGRVRANGHDCRRWYVHPLVAVYLDDINRGLVARKIRAPVMIMQSSGGTMTAADARTRPVFALESGPAAGVIAALAMSRRLGSQNVISLDMGGTTAKASLIENGAVYRRRSTKPAVRSPPGAVSCEEAVSSSVSPRSTSPRSGPVAEASRGSSGRRLPGRAAERGRRARARLLRPGRRRADGDGCERRARLHADGPIADGQIASSAALAGEAVQRVAEPLSLSGSRARGASTGSANARMMRALRSGSSEKGRDPRDFALLA